MAGQLLTVIIALTGTTNSAYAGSCSKETLHRGFEAIAQSVEWVYQEGVEVSESEQINLHNKGGDYRKAPFIPEYIDSIFSGLKTFEPYTYQNVRSSTDKNYLNGVGARNSMLQGYSECIKGRPNECGVIRPEDEAGITALTKFYKTMNEVKSQYRQLIRCERFKQYSLNDSYPLKKEEKYTKKNKYFPKVGAAIRKDVGHWSYRQASEYLLERLTATVAHVSRQRGHWSNKLDDEYKSIRYAAVERIAFLDSYQAQVEQEQEQSHVYEQRQAHIQQLRDKIQAGTLKANTLDLTAIKYNALENLMDTVIGSPMLKANDKYYIGILKVDQLEGGLVRVINSQGVLAREMLKHTFGIDNTHNQRYAYLKMKPADINNLSANQGVRVVGQYVDNYEYVLTTGESKVAPVFKVMFVEAAEQLDVL